MKLNPKYFKVTTSKDQYKSKNVIVASGFYDRPFLLNVPGENLDKVRHYYKEPHPYFAMDIVVIGGANSAVDAALETHRKGAKSVTMIIREKTVGENVKYWARPDIINRIKEGSIKAYFEADITLINPTSVEFKDPNGAHKIPNDFVLAMTGYQPNFELLENLNVRFEKDAFRTPKYSKTTMESNTKGVYLAGVVCGGYKTNKWFIENSRDHAKKVMDHIHQKQDL